MVLALVGVLTPDRSVSETIGMVTLTAIPASVGAALADSILGGGGEGEGERERERCESGYGSELFLTAAGAIFFASDIAPTEEMVLIALRMTTWHLVAAGVASLLLMHAFVYFVEFHAQEATSEGVTRTGLFLLFTVRGYAIALLLSAYVLWTLGRFDGAHPAYAVSLAIVLGTFAYVVHDAMAREDAHFPIVVVTTDTVTVTTAGHVVRVQARNDDGVAAAAVHVHGELRRPEGVIEAHDATIDDVPPRSTREAGLGFDADPRSGRLVVRAVGFDIP